MNWNVHNYLAHRTGTYKYEVVVDDVGRVLS